MEYSGLVSIDKTLTIIMIIYFLDTVGSWIVYFIDDKDDDK